MLYRKDSDFAATSTSLVGTLGERLAERELERNRYRIIMTNFTAPVGRNSRGAVVTGEIDIIAIDDDGTLCFVEVKTRRSDAFAEPSANVTLRKQRQISRTARVYRRIFGIGGITYRFDVVSVVLPAGERPRIDLQKGFWDESKFKKRRWHHETWSEFT